MILLATAALAFFAGMCYARVALQRAVHRARNSFDRLYRHAIRSIDTAQEACGLLAKLPNLRLSPEEAARLDSRQSGLLNAIAGIFDRQASALGGASETVALPEIAWIRTPADPVTKLPGGSAFEANFELMRSTATDGAFSGGLLLARIDKAETLKRRFGIAGIQSFTRKAGALICKSMRECDLACQYQPDTFAVLLPGVNELSGRSAAEKIRRILRRHQFRVEETGPEVLVTASFGFTLCAADEPVELALSRARKALDRSAKRGRNQLHIDDGSRLVAC